MNKFFKSLMAVTIIAMLFVFTVPAQAAYDHYVVNLYADKGFSTAAGGYTPITSDVRYYVFNGGTQTVATIYADGSGTAKTNPVESTTFEVLDRIDFYIDSTTTSVDLAIMTLDGFSLYVRGVTPSTRTLVIDQKPGLHYGFMDWSVTVASQNALTGAATDYWTIPSDRVLLPWPGTGVEVITATCESGDGAGGATDYALRINYAGTGNVFGLGGWFQGLDGAKILIPPSNVYGVAESITWGSLYATVPCTADGQAYLQDLKPYKVATAATVGFELSSCPVTGLATTVDLENGWGFYHYWFIVQPHI